MGKMGKTDKKDKKSEWAIGAGTLLGMGVGFFFLMDNIFAFVGCMFIGIGLGFVVALLIKYYEKKNARIDS